MQRNPYLLNSGIQKAYQTAVKKEQTDRLPLGELLGFDNTARSMSSAGKILKNSRKAHKIDPQEMKASRIVSARTNQSAGKQSSKKDRLQWLAMRKCDLQSELHKVELEMASLKSQKEGTETKAKYPPAERKTATDLLNNIEAFAPSKEQLMNSIKKGRVLDVLRKHIDMETQLRNWKLKVPKEQDEQVRRILIGKHKLVDEDLMLEFDEFDPFVQADPSIQTDTLVNNIYLNHCKCEQHWRNSLLGRFDKDELKAFFSKLDFDKQGVVTLKQLVRELSILLDRNLRTRDLYRIFLRLAEDKQQFTCTQLLKVLSRK